jgi:sulfoxide reductase heme-binding subunit YedZ
VKRRLTWIRVAAHAGASAPLLWLAWRYSADGLGFNPIETLTAVSGKSALALLTASLVCTPLTTFTGWRWPGAVRRALGLWAFAYALGHMSVFVGLDYALDLRAIVAEGLAEKPYIVVGLAALLILAALALTSTRGWQRRLGRRWKSLHRWVYAAAALALLHYRWAAAKDEPLTPLLWAAGVALLLAMRPGPVRKWIVGMRRSALSRVAGSG